jgi:hypothetical protein
MRQPGDSKWKGLFHAEAPSRRNNDSAAPWAKRTGFKFAGDTAIDAANRVV